MEFAGLKESVQFWPSPSSMMKRSFLARCTVEPDDAWPMAVMPMVHAGEVVEVGIGIGALVVATVGLVVVAGSGAEATGAGETCQVKASHATAPITASGTTIASVFAYHDIWLHPIVI